MADGRPTRDTASAASKTCSICGREQSLSAYNRHRHRKDGRDSKCKSCNSEAGRRWYQRRQLITNGLYSTYVAMKCRCYSKHHDSYGLYGAREITVCEEWRNSFEAFRKWAVANGYESGLQLDRIDNDKGYSPDNCRFVTRIANARNKRPRKTPLRNNVRLHVFDVKRIRELIAQGVGLRELARRFNVAYGTVWAISSGRTWKDVV